MKTEDERRSAEVEHLNRWKGTVAWVLGRKVAQDTREFTPQLWVEKDSFHPLRMVFPAGREDIVDVRFEGPRLYRGFAYPRAVSVYGRDGSSWLRDEAIDVTINAKPEENETVIENGFTGAASSVSSSVRALITKYYEILR
jgi:hypothetical protein